MFQTFDLHVSPEETPARMAALRAVMAEKGLGGFLVPRADAHQGENVASRDQRLAWLTGFTGSAGIAVVLADRSALFVDGRYTLQAAGQVDGDLFEIVPIHTTPVDEWLDGVLSQGLRLGYDPWLHGKAEIDKLRKVAKLRGAALVSLPENLVDLVWDDQPPAPAGSVRVHPAEVAGEDAAAKRARIGAKVAEEGGVAAVISLPDSIAWLLNIRGSDIARSPVAHGFALAHADGRVDLVMDPDKIGGAVREHLGNEVSIHPVDALPGLLQALEGPVLLDKASCPLWFSEQLAASGNELIWGQDPCVLPKAVKNEAELAGMRAAHLRDGAAMVRFLCWLDGALAAGETLTEIDVVTKLEGFRGVGGDLEDISFDTIAGSGPNGAIVHYRVTRATNRTIVPGDLLLVIPAASEVNGLVVSDRALAEVDHRVSPPGYLPDFLAAAAAAEAEGSLFGGGNEATRRRDQVTAYLAPRLAAEDYDLVLAYFRGVDIASHNHWRHYRPQDFAEPPATDEIAAHGGRIPGEYEAVDAAIGRLVAARPDADVMVISDHGFEAAEREIVKVGLDFDRLLERLGYLVRDAGGAGVDRQRSRLYTFASPEYRAVKWLRTAAAASDRPGLRAELAADLARVTYQNGAAAFTVRGPRARERRREVDLVVEVEVDRATAGLLLDGDPGPLAGLVTDVARVSGTHGSETHGLFLAAGPDIDPAAPVAGIGIHDVAPTLLYGLGLPVAENFAGRAWTELFTAEFRRAHPLRTIPTWGDPEDGAVSTSGEDEAILRELRALGYLD